MERIKNNVLNCPNCGMPITGTTCEYCGTVFYDFVNVDADGDTYVRMRLNGELLIFKARMTNIEFRQSTIGAMPIYADNRIVHRIMPPDYELSLDFLIVPDDNGVILQRGKREWAAI